ncbi:hypothetical protein [Sphingobium agri]|nr:hypothetical protein [Sphingobium agri]
MPAPLEIARGIFVTLFSSALGSMSGTLLLAGSLKAENIWQASWSDLIGVGASLMPFTGFGSVAVLLPVYLFFRDRGSRKKAYSGVVISGVVGAFIIMFALAVGFGGVAADSAPIWFLALGTPYGFTTGLWWVLAHHVSRSRRNGYFQDSVTPLYHRK